MGYRVNEKAYRKVLGSTPVFLLGLDDSNLPLSVAQTEPTFRGFFFIKGARLPLQKLIICSVRD